MEEHQWALHRPHGQVEGGWRQGHSACRSLHGQHMCQPQQKKTHIENSTTIRQPCSLHNPFCLQHLPATMCIGSQDFEQSLWHAYRLCAGSHCAWWNTWRSVTRVLCSMLHASWCVTRRAGVSCGSQVADDSNGNELSIFDPRAQPWVSWMDATHGNAAAAQMLAKAAMEEAAAALNMGRAR